MKNSNPFSTLQSLNHKKLYSLPTLAKELKKDLSRLPISIRIVLESLLRNCDGKRVREQDILALTDYNAKKPARGDVPFCVARVLLQDFTGVPLLVDLAAMRDAVKKQGGDPKKIEPNVPVDLVIDHSVQVDRSGTQDAFAFNLNLEFQRNQERYTFMKWGQEAFDAFNIIPPGIGICHQVNLEQLASVVMEKEGLLFFDTLVGTDSHTTMINGLGVVGWGVGGIEAEAAMLGQPVSLELPEVIGFCLEGALQEGVTATDLTLQVTEILRKEKVVGKFVEFFGEGTASLSVADRATIANMSPEYGATMGYFPVDEKTLQYLELTGRAKEKIQQVEAYWKAQEMFGIPKKGAIDYTRTLTLNLADVRPCVAEPKRPQDRIPLENVKGKFQELLRANIQAGGYGKNEEKSKEKVELKFCSMRPAPDSGGSEEPERPLAIWSEEEMSANRPYTKPAPSSHSSQTKVCQGTLTHGTIVIAAITSCTNTSNPSVMLGAGLLAKKAIAKGLKVHPLVKTSLAPGSRVVSDYLEKTGLQAALNQLGFQLVAYGCTTCIGNSGPLDEAIENLIKEHDLITASVLSGNRNFEARVHGSVKANFLMSPPLVVAYAIAGRIDLDLTKEPLGIGLDGKPVFLKEIWPTEQEIETTIRQGIEPKMFQDRYANILTDNPTWNEMKEGSANFTFQWDPKSTYIRRPPYFDSFSMELPPRPSLKKLKTLAIFGDSVTTDHISPAGAFKKETPAGQYLLAHGTQEVDFNSYGSRRGNHEVMMRGTFANVRIRNRLAQGKEGGWTQLLPEGKLMTIYDASIEYAKRKTPLLIFAGKDYGMGSSRDWAAKGASLLGVKVVIAESFERIHRSNLIGMGILPLKFQEGESVETLQIEGDETFSIQGIDRLIPNQEVILEIEQKGNGRQVKLISAIDTPQEVEYYMQGGVLPFVLRQFLRP